MEEDRRARLEERRRLAQLRRARAAVSATFRTVARGLCDRGVRFSKLVPERCRAALGTLTDGPGEDERLLWSAIPGGTCGYWADSQERDGLLRRALAACTAAETTVAVIWHPYESGLRLRAADLAAHSDLIAGIGGGTIWIVAAEGGHWLIELAYWDREVCWAGEMGTGDRDGGCSAPGEGGGEAERCVHRNPE